jgi:hypothetical protein
MLRPSGINRPQNANGPMQNANGPVQNANGPMQDATPTDPATANVVARHRVANVDPDVLTVPLNAASVDPELEDLAVLADTR